MGQKERCAIAYEIGTASGYTDLLERLKDFLSDPNRQIGDHPNMTELVAIDDGIGTGESSQAWEVLLFDDQRDTAGDGEIDDCYLKGPGTSGEDEIYVWLDTYSDESNDYYNMRLAGMTGYASGQDIADQPGILQARAPQMLLWQNPIPYWFLGNGRRFVVIAKVSSVYEMCYGGFCLPYGLPTQFPYPLCIGGSYTYSAGDNPRYSSTNEVHRGFPNPYGAYNSTCTGAFNNTTYKSSLYVLQGTAWICMRNKVASLYYETNNIWPYLSSAEVSGGVDFPEHAFSTGLRENIDGSYPVFPLVIMIKNPNNHIMGELQGCFAVPGYGGISAEDTFTINGDTYIAFPILPNADANDFMCIKKE